MTSEITNEELDKLITNCVLYAKFISRYYVPIDTGNMRLPSYKYEHTEKDKWCVYFNTEGEHKIGTLDGIAPYVKWTNEKHCRTQGWFDDKMLPIFVRILGEELENKGMKIKKINKK